MATNTYVALSMQTLTNTATEITFSSIPQTYTDLELVIYCPTAGAGANARLQFGNGTIDTGTNYSLTQLYATGSTVGTLRGTNLTYGYGGTTDQGGFSRNYISNYSSTTTFKSWLARGACVSYTDLAASVWRSNSAVNTIKITTDGGAYPVGSTFTLYGIASASVGAKATGGTIYSDSQYIYHVFTSTGAFVPTQALTTEVLAVAGGGGTSIVASGGGGAGGVLYSASTSFASGTTYTCTVGAGGTGVNNRDTVGSNGTNSTITGTGFTTLTAVGGGGGAGFPNSGSLAGGNGGSGGGGSGATGGTGGTATSGQGNVGGIGDPTSGVGTGGGGGGASVAGGNGSLGFSGSGGNGTSAYSSWLSVIGIGELVSGTYYIAGGGSGGAYNTSVARSAGLGGGGKGSAGTGATPGANGIDNTGGGAGGTGGITGATGAKGGSGLVIVRYPR